MKNEKHAKCPWCGEYNGLRMKWTDRDEYVSAIECSKCKIVGPSVHIDPNLHESPGSFDNSARDAAWRAWDYRKVKP